MDLFAEDLEPAHRFFDLQLSLRRDDGYARGVIPAVFQMREPVQQDGGRLFLTMNQRFRTYDNILLLNDF